VDTRGDLLGENQRVTIACTFGLRRAKNRRISSGGTQGASVSKRGSTKYQDSDPLPIRLRNLNRVAAVVSCVSIIGLVALFFFALSRTREAAYTDYTPPGGVRVADEWPPMKRSAVSAAEQDKARPIRDDSRQFGTSRRQSFPAWVAGQPRPRMVFQDTPDQTKPQANCSPGADSPRTPLPEDAESTRWKLGAVSPGEKPAPPSPAPRFFRVPSPRLATGNEVER